MNAKIKRQIKIKQRRLTRIFLVTLTMHLFIVITILTTTLVKTSENNKIEGEDNTTVHESEVMQNSDNDKQDTATPPANVSPNVTTNEAEEEEIELEVIEPETIVYDRGISDSDQYLLAKLAMAEAEGESLETKILIIMVVINRTENRDFPDTIEEVIFEKTKDVYQFSPVIPGGRWWTTEPNEECFEAVRIVNSTPYDISDGALYFEACAGESWHSRNLTLICESDNTRFYK